MKLSSATLAILFVASQVWAGQTLAASSRQVLRCGDGKGYGSAVLHLDYNRITTDQSILFEGGRMNPLAIASVSMDPKCDLCLSLVGDARDGVYTIETRKTLTGDIVADISVWTSEDGEIYKGQGIPCVLERYR